MEQLKLLGNICNDLFDEKSIIITKYISPLLDDLAENIPCSEFKLEVLHYLFKDSLGDVMNHMNDSQIACFLEQNRFDIKTIHQFKEEDWIEFNHYGECDACREERVETDISSNDSEEEADVFDPTQLNLIPNLPQVMANTIIPLDDIRDIQQFYSQPSVLPKDEANHECLICKELLCEPVSLFCQHNYCFECLNDYLIGQNILLTYFI